VLWHQAPPLVCGLTTRAVQQARAHCDEYFYLKHRAEARGIGGIFYDDLNDRSAPIALPWAAAFELLQSVVVATAMPTCRSCAAGAIPLRRARAPLQLYRRGRYVEFNWCSIAARCSDCSRRTHGCDPVVDAPDGELSYRSDPNSMHVCCLPHDAAGRNWLGLKT